MEPDSISLIVVLLAAAVGCLAAVIGLRALLVRVVAGLLAISLSVAGGVALVNDYYGYYQTWTQLSADLSGNYSHFTPAATESRNVGRSVTGRLERVTLAGARSGITRGGLVYLPPQYFQRRYAHTYFPTVELLHGTPGSPSDWVVNMDVVTLMDRLISQNLLGPMILVIPRMSSGQQFQECVNAPGALDDTYVSQDVWHDLRPRFRIAPTAAERGVAGYSSGGYCAANLALRHRAAFGAAGVLDGYFRPQDGPAAAALHSDRAAEAANDPLLLAAGLRRGENPMPSFWVSAGTGDSADLQGAVAFGAALHGVEAVTLYREHGAGHNYYAWRPAVPRMLAWMWTQLAPPELRVQFPVAGAVRNSVIPAQHPPGGARHEPRHSPAGHRSIPPPVRTAVSAAG